MLLQQMLRIQIMILLNNDMVLGFQHNVSSKYPIHFQGGSMDREV